MRRECAQARGSAQASRGARVSSPDPIEDPPLAARPTPRARPLAGRTLVVTRPSGTGAPLARRARALGAGVVLLPGLRLRGPEDPRAAAAALRAAQSHDVIVFTSPAAVRFAFALRPAFRPSPRTRVLALGDGTRRALARHAIHAGAPVAGGDSEALLALPELAHVDGLRIALVGAPGGRDLIAPALRRRGARVLPVHVYRRAPPRLTRRHHAALAAAPLPLVTLLSSGEALANLVAQLPPASLRRLRAQTLVASSERLAGLARTLGFGRIACAASALPDDLLAAAANVPPRRR
jgi:uroporphyrinogen-III synthase